MRASLAAIAVLCATSVSAMAQAQTYVLHPFVIPTATSVSVAAINDSGAAAGSYVAPAQPNGAGFVGPRGAVTTMAMISPPDGGSARDNIPIPTGIDNRGTVIGTYSVLLFRKERLSCFAT